MFSLQGIIHIEASIIAIGGAAVMLVITRAQLERILHEVDWPIATSKKEEAIRSKVLDVPSEPETNETSGLMDKPPITKEESKISPASSSKIPLSETTPTNVSVE